MITLCSFITAFCTQFHNRTPLLILSYTHLLCEMCYLKLSINEDRAFLFYDERSWYLLPFNLCSFMFKNSNEEFSDLFIAFDLANLKYTIFYLFESCIAVLLCLFFVLYLDLNSFAIILIRSGLVSLSFCYDFIAKSLFSKLSTNRDQPRYFYSKCHFPEKFMTPHYGNKSSSSHSLLSPSFIPT